MAELVHKYKKMHPTVAFCILQGMALKRTNSDAIITLLKLKGENVMEAVFLLLLFVLEIVFSIYIIMEGKSRKAWVQGRTLIRSIELICFFLYMLLPTVHFGFRFALCVSLLVIRLVIALIFWMCKRNGKNKELKTESFEADGTKREVPVYIYFPDTEAGKFPLVVFSHGAFGYYQSNTSTYMGLASNGYVVASVEHPYHSFFTRDTDGKTVIVNKEFLKEVQCVNDDTVSPDEAAEIYSKWLTVRTADMNYVIDSIKSAGDGGRLDEEWYVKGPEDKEEILEAVSMADTRKIGVMGHSLGGASSVELGRIREDIGAVIDLDGTMLGEETILENGAIVFNEEPYPVPLMTIDNEEHHWTSVERGTDYVNAAILANAKDGRNTYFAGSGHMNFTDLPLFSPILAGFLGTGDIDSESCIRQTNEIVLQYYNYYLKDEGEITLQECYE